MGKKYIYLILTCLVLPLFSCRNESGADTEADASLVYEDSVYCFNQRSIVTLNGLKGIVDTDGRMVLAPEWEKIEFLNDDIALIAKSGIWHLCTRDGRVFAQSADSLSLESNYSGLYEDLLEEDSQYWDRVLDSLESLEEACLGTNPGHMDNSIVHARSELQRLLEVCPGGSMTPTQMERLAKIESEFKSMYRR